MFPFSEAGLKKSNFCEKVFRRRRSMLADSQHFARGLILPHLLFRYQGLYCGSGGESRPAAIACNLNLNCPVRFALLLLPPPLQKTKEERRRAQRSNVSYCQETGQEEREQQKIKQEPEVFNSRFAAVVRQTAVKHSSGQVIKCNQ